jgi:hypothetical protein
MTSPFDSPSSFIRAAQAAKNGQRQAINEELSPLLDDPHLFAVPPDLLATIEGLEENYGDEALKQIAMFCLGRWCAIHGDILQEHSVNDDLSAAVHTMGDITTIKHALQSISTVGSFGGDDDWRKMIKEELGQAVLEACEDRGITPEDFFQNNEILQ